jgi:radical SAM protein with 4Fe4S-binding SPASM domain
LHNLGIRDVDLSLNLWIAWTAGDGRRLEKNVAQAARLWRAWLPEFGLNWFDAKVGELAALPQTHEDTRCGFGDGEIAVAPSGRLYPCERLIGEDRLDHPLRLAGHALEGQDFLGSAVAPFKTCTTCSSCVLHSACDTVCRCSNFIRTGNVNRPDGLLCILNKATARAVNELFDQEKQVCYG